MELGRKGLLFLSFLTVRSGLISRAIAPDASRFNLRTCKLQIFLGGERGMPSDLTRSVSFTQWSASHDETIFHHLCYIRIGWVTFVGGFNLQLQD